MYTRWARVARGTLAACFAVFVAALFHAGMGGGVPSILAITVSLAFAVPTCVLLSAKRMAPHGSMLSGPTLWRQLVAVDVSQFILHAFFGIAPGDAQFSSATGSAHVHAASHLTMTGGASDSATAMGGMHESPLMWIGHASAVIVTVAAMRYGERTLRLLVATTAIRIVAFVERITLIPVHATAALRRAADARPVILPAPRILIGRMRHRGPPVGLLIHT